MNQARPKQADLPEDIRKRYIKCDKKLFDLQREYDTMTYCSSQLRKMMTANVGKHEKADLKQQAGLLDTFVKECVERTKQYEAIEEARKKVRLDCVKMRDMCNTHARAAVKLLGWTFLEEGKLWLVTTAHHYGDRSQNSEDSDDYLQIWQIGIAVGVLGATVTATSFFAAVRGRLDLLSWAFTCFVFVVSWVSRRQAFTPPDRLGADKHRWSVTFDMLCITLPILAGAMLLALSFALSDPNGPADVGSHTVILTANYTLVSILSLSVFNFLFSLLAGKFVRQWRRDFSENPHEFASHLVDSSERWVKYQAEEDGFSKYCAQPCFTKSRLAFNEKVTSSWLGRNKEVAVAELELESQTAGP